MTHAQLLGLAVAVLAGLCIGLVPVPLKQMRRFQYEHWACISMLTGLIIVPWAITVWACPDISAALRSIGSGVLLKANVFAIGWGIANILFLQCLVRIGVSLTSGIVGGLTVALGVLMPMVFKGSGIFQRAPGLDSRSGWIMLGAVTVLLLGVCLAANAGLARERTLHGGSQSLRAASGGLVMAVTAGLLGSGISFAFVYSQGPVVAAMRERGVSEPWADVSVWALALSGGALANVVYPAYLLTRRRSWAVMAQQPREVGLAVLLGLMFIGGFSLLGQGMLLLGALGASVGFGVQQSVQMLSNQAVGFATGEWRNTSAARMYWAIGLLITAIVILSLANSMATVE